jgi:beta-lactamase regulating signal transducer with metallopeptidase domain
MDTQIATNWASSSLWVIVVFIGAFVLFGAILWARSKNKAVTPEENRRTEQATRDLYDGDTVDQSTKHH